MTIIDLNNLPSDEIQPIINIGTPPEWINKLTVYFDSGDIIFEEAHRSQQSSTSVLRAEGKAYSLRLPEVLFDADLRGLAETIRTEMPTADREVWLSDLLDSYAFTTHINCWHEDPRGAADIAMLIDMHKYNPAKLEEEVHKWSLRSGVPVVGFTEWLESTGWPRRETWGKRAEWCV